MGKFDDLAISGAAGAPLRPLQPTIAGNIDLDRRPIVNNQDGSFSTIESMSVNLDGVEWLIPTIREDGVRMTAPEAVEHFKKTRQHLGAFESPERADEYAKWLSNRQGQMIARPGARRFDALADQTPGSASLGVRLNAGANPDRAAEAAKLARRYGVPANVAEQFIDDYKAKAAGDDARRELETAPKTAEWLDGDATRSRMAHDDVGNLTAIERAIRTISSVPGMVWRGIGPGAASSLANAAAFPFEVIGQAQGIANRALGIDAETNAAARIGEFFRGVAEGQDRAAASAYTAPADANIWERGIGSGVISAAQNALTLPFAVVGGLRAGMTAFGGLTFGQTYGKAREAGLEPAQSAVYAAQDTAAEVVTELAPTAKLLGDLAAKTGAAKMLVGFMMREIPGELAATTWQSFNEWANVNPDKPIREWVESLPEQLAETAIATVVGGGAQVGVGKAAQTVVDRVTGRAREAEMVERSAAMIEDLVKVSEAANLKGRDATTFKEFVAQVADESGEAPVEMYIDGPQLVNVLNQSGVSREELEAIAPVVAAQLEAAAAGADVRVPVSELLGAREAVTAPLIDHLRMPLPGGELSMTRAEARTVVAEAETERTADIEREIAKLSEQDEARAQVKAFEERIASQLVQFGRQRPEVARTNAKLLAAGYGTLAARTGKTLEQFSRDYGIDIGPAGPKSFDQPGTPAFDAWFGDSKVVDDQGKPLVVYHGTTAYFSAFDPDKRGSSTRVSDAKKGFFFVASGKAASEFTWANGEMTGSVMPSYLSMQNPFEVKMTGEWEPGKYDAAIDYAKRDGRDGVIIRGATTLGTPGDVYIAFRPEQIKSVFNRGTYDPRDPDILKQQAAAAEQTETAAFKQWSNNAPLVRSEVAETHEFKTGEKVVVEAFHGTQRPDRVGVKFLKKRATSGPMSFFTSDPTVGSNYATGKQDTSLANEDQDYPNWFKVKFKGDRSPRDIVRAWYGLSREQQDAVAALAPRVMFGDEIEEDGGNVIVLGPEDHKSGTGSYDYNLAETQRGWDKRGNPLKALVEDWLNSGNLFDDEARFIQVLKLAGFPVETVEYDPPTASYPAVYKAFVAMTNPLVTGDFPQGVRDALNDAAKRDRTRAKSSTDQWDKNSRTLREWVAEFNKEDNQYVWTSIPDKVTAVFRSLGYDGIIDVGGKGGGPTHRVYIPFEETQVKSAIGNRGTFDRRDANILRQGAPGQPGAPGSAYDEPYETDLFGNPLPPAARKGRRARSDRAGLRGNVQPAAGVQDTEAPPGEYRARTVVGVTAQRKLGAAVIKSAADAAAATRYLYKSAVERFDGIVTDKDGKPLAVIGGFKGALSQTSIYPATLLGEAVRIKGAANVWFSHNHPSGRPELSRADENLNQTLADAFRGSGIEPRGLLAIAGGDFRWVGDDGMNYDGGPIPAASGETEVPAIERELVEDGGKRATIESPAQARAAAMAAYRTGEPGLLLLNAQHDIAAWVPAPPEMLGRLRGTGGLNAIYRAVSESNAGAAILVHGGEFDEKRGDWSAGTVGMNIGAALSKTDVRVLDSINAKTGESAAERGRPMVGSSLYQGERAQIKLPESFASDKAVISLFENADLSSFLHESGHLFLEIHADIARKIQQQINSGASVTDGERGIVEDFNRTLKWFGVTGSPEMSALDAWSMMTLDEKREHHETFARGWEAYAMEGKAPSIELQGVFAKFSAWLKQIYRTLRGLNVELTDEVRGVMSRLLATDEAIAEAEAQRNMGALFRDAETAGMTLQEFDRYQALGEKATADAKAKLDARALADMKWLRRARDKALRARQAEADELRRETRIEVRAEVYSEPVYRAWQFLTGRASESAKAEKDKASKSVDVTKDSLLVAIAKLGGINRDSARKDLSVSEDDLRMKGSVFGHPPFRAEGGRNADDIRETLTELGYLMKFDEFGRTELRELEDKIIDELGGSPQYSASYDYEQAMAGPRGMLPEGALYGKLNTQALQLRYGNKEDAVWRKLSARRMTNSDGFDPEIVAVAFGFEDGDALVQALAEAMPPSEVIEARTDQRMLEKYGDITSPEALQRAADEAVHNEARARTLSAELKALQEAMTVRGEAGKNRAGRRMTVDLLARAARDYAREIVGRLRIRDIRPAQYASAETRNAKLAEKAFGAAKLEEAAMHKRNQLVNHEAAREAYEALDDVKSAVRYFRKFDKRIESIDKAYQDQIEQLLEDYDFRPTTLRGIDERKSLAAWVAEQQALGNPVDIPEALLDRAARKSYKDMTVGDVRALIDVVKQLEHVGRLKNQLLRDAARRDLDGLAEDIGDRVRSSRPKRSIPREGLGRWQKELEEYASEIRKLSSYVRQMDGAEDGPLFEHVIAPANVNGAVEDLRLREFAQKLREVLAPARKLPGGLEGRRSREMVDLLGVRLPRFARMAVLLNYGNEQGRQRMESADGWGPEQIAAVAKTLTPAELEIVNELWRMVGAYWPEIAALEEKFKGQAPEKVEAIPFAVTASDGTEVMMRGGYYPLKYQGESDTSPPTEDPTEAMTRMGRRMVATTRHGHTQERMKEVEKRVRLDFGVLVSHVQEVVHDLTWREWVHDTNKILTHPDVSGAVIEHYGRAVYDSMRKTVAAVAIGEQKARGSTERWLLRLRNAGSRAVMGFSLQTMLLQPLGLLQSMNRIGYGPVLRGMLRMGEELATANDFARKIAEKSDVMRGRIEGANFTREMRELGASERSRALIVLDDAMFYGMRKLQLIADLPTWWGQYEKTLNEQHAKATAAGMEIDEAVAKEIERKAVEQADRAVKEAQGAGEIVDMAEFQRSHPMWAMFMSFFSATYQLIVESTQATNFKNPVAVAKWMGDMMVLAVLPSTAAFLMMQALRGSGDDDDEESFIKEAGKELGSFMLSMLPIARELTGIVKGYEYNGPVFLRSFVELQRALAATGRAIENEEVDDRFVAAWVRTFGYLFGLPVAQMNRSWLGYKAWSEGEADFKAVLFGPPLKD